MKRTPDFKATLALAAAFALAPAAFSQVPAAPAAPPAPAAPATQAAPAAPAAAAAPAAPAAPIATPKDPKSPIAGVADGRGPTGPVEIRILEPKAGEVIPVAGAAASGSPVRLVVELKNFETFLDPATKTGQAVAIVLDGLPYFSHYDATKPWTFKKIPPGTHTLRVVPIRPWGEPIREPGAFASVTFSVGEKDGKNAPAPGEPTLTLLSPRGRAKYTPAQAAALTFDFVVAGCRVTEEEAPDACRVRYKIGDRPEVRLTKPASAPIEALPAGKYGFVAGLTRDDKVIPGAFTLAQGSFEVEGDAAAPNAPAAPATPGSASATPAAPAAPSTSAPKAN